MRVPFNKAKLSCPFGPRHIFGKDEFHKGIDFCIPDKKVLACETGKVLVAGVNGGYGNCVMIEHPNKLISVYGHLSKILVRVGQTVQEGEQIGVEGSTGRSTGSHLHFEFRPSRYERSTDQKLNPANVIGFDNKRGMVEHMTKAVKPKWQSILEEKVDSPQKWVEFVERMKDDPTGKWLPSLIEKLGGKN